LVLPIFCRSRLIVRSQSELRNRLVEGGGVPAVLAVVLREIA